MCHRFTIFVTIEKTPFRESFLLLFYAVTNSEKVFAMVWDWVPSPKNHAT